MSPVRMSEVESAMRAVLAFNQAFNQHDLARMMQLVSADCITEGFAPAPDGAVYTGKDAIARYYADLFGKFPDVHIKTEDVFGFGKRCVMRWKFEWGQEHLRGVDIVRVEDDLICERLSYVKGNEAGHFA
jgi:predicted SnoaL-like aldol condensation-catalyzing enzyme